VPAPLVTIVTPSLNQGRFIRATIESVLSQDYNPLEYIIMDGGSTDETSGIVQEYSSRLTWVSEKDRGQSHAINKGFRMGRGEIVAWLNSDDLILPGAVARAAQALESEPNIGAVYGEGYQIDHEGKNKGRFPFTEPFNLWKLVYLWDYVLQQTVYFRKSVIDEVGYLDENLHWGMDWDLLVRIGKRYGLRYVPQYLGSLREYGEAKSFSGGAARFRELVQILRRHGKRRYPPGYFVYGLDTYEKIWCSGVERWTPAFLSGPSERLRTSLSRLIRRRIDRSVYEAQGWYSDGWATTKIHYMLPQGGRNLRIYGWVPPNLTQQSIKVCYPAGETPPILLFPGDFDVTAPLSKIDGPLELTVVAKQFFVPEKTAGGPDTRKLSYMLRGIEWAL